nr:uncharacterized protein LOC112545066 [Pelodiscus sinensis]|eukprot:XP_025038149.1 uncharacterized protein LOC112545066 [Pelodiscus sinensis]
MSKGMRLLRWGGLICCFGRKRRSSAEEIFSFSITDWDPGELERVRMEDFSRLFPDDISMDGGCTDIEVVAMVHRREDDGDLLEEMDQPGGGEDEGGGDNNRGPPGDDQGGEAHTILHRRAEKQQGALQGPADQRPGRSTAREQEHPGILKRPVNHGEQESLAQEDRQPETLEEPVGADEQESDSMAKGGHARLVPPTDQVKEVLLQACRPKKARLLLLSGHHHRGPAAVSLMMSLGGQKILLRFPETCLL